MKIAIISDIHDNLHNTIEFLKEIDSRNIDRIIFLGDFGANGIVKILASSKIPVYAIFGNNDGDVSIMMKTSIQSNSNLEIYPNRFSFIEIDARKIFLTHYDELSEYMAKSGEFDVVFYGHNHKREKHYINNCLVLNPGELSGHKTGIVSYAIYNTKSNKAEFFEIKNKVLVKTDSVREYMEKNGVEFRK